MNYIPIIPNPESNEDLLRMIELISEHPSVLDIHTVFLKISVRKKGNVEELNFIDIKTQEYRKKELHMIENGIPLPNGKKGVNKAIILIRDIYEKNWKNLPETFREIEVLNYDMQIRFNWKDFQDYSEIDAEVTEHQRKLVFGYYAYFKSKNVYDKNGYIDYLSEPFINLFRLFKSMFHIQWPDKYILFPYDTDSLLNQNKKSKLRSLLRNTLEPSNYRKIDEFFKSKKT